MEMIVIIRDGERLAYWKEASDWEQGISLLADAHLAWEVEQGHAQDALNILPKKVTRKRTTESDLEMTELGQALLAALRQNKSED